MCHKLIGILLFFSLSSVLSRHVPRYSELDEEDQHLFRAAFETPSFDHFEEEEDEEGNFDLMKDGLWAMKAKIKELKAFDKALAANFLSTKLKIKDLLENHMGDIWKHHHKKKPVHVHEYQAPAYQPPQYGVPQYGGGVPQYGHDPYYGH